MSTVRAVRLSAEPVVRPHMDDRMGSNINGPSLIRVPDWIEEPLGRYYLYFADHKGSYIRLACADALAGPWRMYTPGRSRWRRRTSRPCVRIPTASAREHAGMRRFRLSRTICIPTSRRPTCTQTMTAARFGCTTTAC